MLSTGYVYTALAGVGVALTLRLMWRKRAYTFHSFLASCGDDELDKVAFTSRFVAAERGLESARPDALFHDPYAAALGGKSGLAMSARFSDECSKPYSFQWKEYHMTWMAIRTKYIDDKIDAFAAQCQTSFQFVNLGAGLDSRAFRLGSLRGKCRACFEVDVREVHAAKQNAMLRLGATALCPRVCISLDLAKNELRPLLLLSGFDENLPTIWLLEGLTMYLSEDVNRSIMQQIQQLHSTCPAPHAICSGFLGDTSKLPRNIPFWKSPEAMEAFVGGFGFCRVSISRYGDPELHYGRYPAGRAPDASNCFCYATTK